MIADLWITYADGTQQLVKSDNSWKVSVDGPNRYDNYYQGETYDARKAITGWNLPSFDAFELGGRERRAPVRPGTLKAQETEPTRILATYPASTFKSLTTPQGRRAGLRHRPEPRRLGDAERLRLPGRARRSRCSTREKLNADGTVNNSGFSESGQLQTDIYVCDGTGTADKPGGLDAAVLDQGLPVHPGQRAVEPGELGRRHARSRSTAAIHATITADQQLGTDHAQVGDFGTSNAHAEHDQHDGHRTTVQNCDWGGITCDTPIWEKDPWTGDEQLSAPTESDYYDTQLEYQKDFQDMLDTALADDGRGDAAHPDQPGLRPRRADVQVRHQRGRDADLGRVLVRPAVGVLPALRRRPGAGQDLPDDEEVPADLDPAVDRQGRRQLPLHADVRPR